MSGIACPHCRAFGQDQTFCRHCGRRLAVETPVLLDYDPAAIAEEPEWLSVHTPASWGSRVAATLVDALVLAVALGLPLLAAAVTHHPLNEILPQPTSQLNVCATQGPVGFTVCHTPVHHSSALAHLSRYFVLMALVEAVLWALHRAWVVSSPTRGAGVGMSLLGLQVVSFSSGRRIGLIRALWREVVMLVLWASVVGLVIDGVWALLNRHHRALHDVLAGAMVAR